MQSSKTAPFYIKTKRTFTGIRAYGWILTLLVGVGGQFFPVLGLLVPPIMLTLIGMSTLKGKYWCGNYCPHGSFFDSLLQPVSRNIKIPSLFASRFFISAVLIFFMYNLARRFTTITGAAGTADLLNQAGLVFSTTYLMVLLVGGLLAVTISPRTWCRFCPMGTFQFIFYKLGKVIKVNKKSDWKITSVQPALCRSCGKCARVCPLQLSPYTSFGNNNQFEDENCIRCNTCIRNCPPGILQPATAKEAEKLEPGAALESFSEDRFTQPR